LTTTTIVPLYDTLTMFKVDAVGMDIKKLILNAQNPKYDYDKKEITVLLEKKYSTKDTIVYTVNYKITDPEKGMYFIQPDSIFPNKRYEVWTQGEGEDNRYWFPSYDYPNDKATTETFITIAKQYTTLSNGNLLGVKDNTDGTKTWHWVLNHPHSSYLVMLAAGDYEIIRDNYLDIPIETNVPKGMIPVTDSAFYLTSDIIKFFSESIGFKYAWGHLGQVGVQDYIYGAMENTGAIVYYDAIYHDERAFYPDYSSRGIIAHETAHQWWGDVVTCRNWNEIWLNESFATYFDALYTEHHLGKDEFDYQVMKGGNSAITADSTNARKPIYTKDGLTVNTYDKGSVVLNMLRNQIGTENFWKAMNLYITKNQFQPVVTQNLIDAVNQAMDDPMLDRKPLDYTWFFNEWIYRAGQPEYRVSYTFDDNSKELKITASQVQRLDSSSVFMTPVEVEIITASSRQKTEIIPTYQPQDFMLQLDTKPVNVIFNKGNKVLSKLYFSKPKEDWLYQLDKSEDAIDRLTAIKGLKDFLDDEAVVHALNNSMQSDKFWGVRYESVSMLGKSGSKAAAGNLMEYYSRESDSRVKRNILLSLANLKQNCSGCIGTQELLDFILGNIRNERSYYTIADGITAISRFLSKDKIYDIASPFINMDSHRDIIRRSVIAALDSTNDKRAEDIFLKYAVIGSTAQFRNSALNKLHPYLNESRVVDFLNSKLTDRDRSTKFTVLNLLEKAKNTSSVPYIESLIGKTKDEELIKRAKEVLRKIE
jgi:aminopeptidase N